MGNDCPDESFSQRIIAQLRLCRSAGDKADEQQKAQQSLYYTRKAWRRYSSQRPIPLLILGCYCRLRE